MKTSFLRLFTLWFLPLFIPWLLISLLISGGETFIYIVTGIILCAPVAAVLAMFHKWYREWRPKKELNPSAVTLSGKRILTPTKHKIIVWGKVVFVSHATLVTFGLYIYLAFEAMTSKTDSIDGLYFMYGMFGKGFYDIGLIMLGIVFLAYYFIEKRYEFTQELPKYRTWMIPTVVLVISVLSTVTLELMYGSPLGDIATNVFHLYIFPSWVYWIQVIIM